MKNRETMLYEEMEEDKVICNTCAQNCEIPPGEKGFCGVRQNRDGKLYSLVYGRPVTVSVDPIEKKPFFHFAPGSRALSIGTVGCNLKCSFCFAPETTVINNSEVKKIENLFSEGINELNVDGGSVRFTNKTTFNHKGNETKIRKVFKHRYEGNLVKITPFYLPKIVCTPSHKIFAVRKDNSNKIEKIKASEINKNWLLIVPKLNSFSNLEKIDVKEILSQNKTKFKKHRKKTTISDVEEILKLSEKGFTSKEIAKKFDLHPTYLRKLRVDAKKMDKENLLFEDNKIVEEGGKIRFKTEKKPGIPKIIKLDKKLAKVLGYFCAEGWVTKNKDRPNSYSILFSFGKEEKKLVKETKKIIKDIFGIETKIRKRRTTITVETGKSSLALLFKNLCGSGAKNKKVPNIINKAKKGVIKEFLLAYIKGDGCIKEEEISMNTVSKNLALGVFWLFLKLDLLPSFYEFGVPSKKRIEDRIVNQSTLIYYVKIRSKIMKRFLGKEIKHNANVERAIKFIENDKFYLVPIRKIEKEKYSGPVYNFETSCKEHSYLSNFIGVGNCQNYRISQEFAEVEGERYSPEQLVKRGRGYGCEGIAYTYTEPAVFYEYVYDTAKKAQTDLYNVLVTNGYFTPESIKRIANFIDAANVDLKGDYLFYKKHCLGKHGDEPVKKTLLTMKEKDIFTEITTMLIPGLNDDEAFIANTSKWIAENLGEETPLHFSKFYPHYKMKDRQPTPIETLERAREIAKEAGLWYVYIGNVPGHKYENTYCRGCGKLIIERSGFKTGKFNIDRNLRCTNCGEKIPIAGKSWIPPELFREE